MKEITKMNKFTQSLYELMIKKMNKTNKISINGGNINFGRGKDTPRQTLYTSWQLFPPG